MSSMIMELVGYQVQGTAEWRHMKAEEFPDDTRNQVAAEELERLSEEIAQLDGSDLAKEIEALNDRISELELWDVSTRLGEAVSDALRSYGFRGGYGDGREFLEWYRDVTKELIEDEIEIRRDDGVPAPDLDAEVEASEEVAAARRAYEQVKAKALAEARKRL